MFQNRHAEDLLGADDGRRHIRIRIWDLLHMIDLEEFLRFVRVAVGARKQGTLGPLVPRGFAEFYGG